MTSKPWLPDHAIDAALAAQLIADQMPELAGLPTALIAEGWDNSAFQVGDDLLFRFPRRAIAVPLLETEVRVLTAIAHRLPVPVTVPSFVGRPSPLFPAPFAGYRFLKGKTGCQHAFEPEHWPRLAADLGGFLRCLHDIPPDEAGEPPPDELGRTDFHAGFERDRARLKPLFETEHSAIAQRLASLIDAVEARLPSSPQPPPPRLVHGDLYGRHALVSEDGHLAGIIDWGDVHQGDVAVDLSVVFSFLPADARGAFFKTYGGIDAQTELRARARALHSTANVLAYGVDVEDGGMLRLARMGAENLGA